MIVFSPLTSLRIRLGQVILYSSAGFGSVAISDEMISLTMKLRTPIELEKWLSLSVANGIRYSDAEKLLDMLIQYEIVISVSDTNIGYKYTDNPLGTFKKCWWDPYDMGYYDARMVQMIQTYLGWSNSLKEQFPLDKLGNPIPWFSYPAVQYIDTFDLSKVSIFEFGSGASTLYFETRCKKIISIEHDINWAETMFQKSSGKMDLHIYTEKQSYCKSILDFNQRFDIIIIDATPDFREDCVSYALKRLAPGGFIILDDSAVYQNSYQKLSEMMNTFPIDFIGLSPMEDIIQTTSFFWDHSVISKTIRKRHPYPPGSPEIVKR